MKLENVYLEKVRCSLSAKFWVDFDPWSVYALFAAHESIRMHVTYAASNGLVLEGADISNAYLFGKLDVPITMEQRTDSSWRLQ